LVVDEKVLALNNICLNANSTTFGTFLATLDANLDNDDAYSGALLSVAQIAKLDGMCRIAELTTLGTVLNGLLDASKNATAATKISDAHAKLLNGMCFGAQKCTLGTLLQSCADRINHMQLSDDAMITSYAIPLATGAATIDNVNYEIAVEMPFGTDVTALVASFMLSTGASAKIGAVAQVSSTTPNNFTNPVIYGITSESGDVINTWTVTVTVAAE